MLQEIGTNETAVVDAVALLLAAEDKLEAELLVQMAPAPIFEDTNAKTATEGRARLEDAGAKARVMVTPSGTDIARGWGWRGSVAADYLMDQPVQLGQARLGPDLANLGYRVGDNRSTLLHLYAPRLSIPKSFMPPYRFLFENRRVAFRPSDDALELPEELAPEPGHEIVPTDDARALVAYLRSLKQDAVLFETPMTVETPEPDATLEPQSDSPPSEP